MLVEIDFSLKLEELSVQAT